MYLGVRYSVDIAILLIALSLQLFAASSMLPEGVRARRAYRIALGASSSLLAAGVIGSIAAIFHLLPGNTVAWLRGSALGWAIALIGAAVFALLLRPARKFSPERRRLLDIGVRTAVAAPLACVGFGMFVQRNRFRLTEVSAPIPGLPKDLAGLRIVQVTDVHLSAYLSEAEFARAIDMANETKAHLAVVTGDLVSVAGDPIDAAIRQVARLKADAGILGCHGNHEVYAGVLGYATEQASKHGVRILRAQAESLRFGSTPLNLVGVDYQQLRSPYLVGVEKLVRPGEVNILLSHNPDVFPVAARQGFALTLAGHTHGGQIDVEILHQHLNITRFFTPYTNGLYREGGSAIYVSAGIGTIGVPMRFGAPPEVALIRLCAT